MMLSVRGVKINVAIHTVRLTIPEKGLLITILMGIELDAFV